MWTVSIHWLKIELTEASGLNIKVRNEWFIVVYYTIAYNDGKSTNLREGGIGGVGSNEWFARRGSGVSL